MANILIVDDDKSIQKIFSGTIDRIEHTVLAALTLEEGLKICQSNEIDIVFLDVVLPDGSGLEMISEIKTGPFPPEVIVMTGLGSREDAEIAIKKGAWDYIEKPLSFLDLRLILNRTLQYRNAIMNHSRSPASFEMKLNGPAGTSPSIKESMKALRYAAMSEVNVLLTGETGTGKGFYAIATHENSLRKKHNFVLVDCTSIPATLVESTLFGSEKGAFTDAKQSRQGLVQQADGGTLFLDEVSELPTDLQKSFLQVLDTHRYRPVGGNKELESNFRLVAATNRNLKEMVSDGLFRNDLYYRLHSLSISLTPLRERMEDIEALVQYHMSKVCKRLHVEPKSFSANFFEFLQLYNWPGNVRELFNTIETVIVQTPGEPILYPRHLPESVRIRVARNSVGIDPKEPPAKRKEQQAAGSETLPSFPDFEETTLKELRKNYFLQLMTAAKGNIKEACRISGLSRSSLYSMLKKHGIFRVTTHVDHPLP
jgi:two-component system, NtrC family, response regulator